MQVEIPVNLVNNIHKQVVNLYNHETKSFLQLVPEYLSCIQHCRDLEVRVGQLDKEAAELRDENASLHHRQQKLEAAATLDYMNKSVDLEAEVSRLSSEVTELLKGKSKVLEDLVAASTRLEQLQREHQALTTELAEEKEFRESLEEQVLVLEQTRDEQAAAQKLAEAELQARQRDKESALMRAEQAERELNVRVDEVLKMKDAQAQAMNELNREREDMLESSRRAMAEAQSERDAVEQLRRRLMAAAGPAAASSLRQAMGLEGATGGALGGNMTLPTAPAKSMVAHKGGCCGIDFDRAGNLVATGGADRLVQTWELTHKEQSNTFSGMLASVNDVSFTSDGHRLLAAGADKSLRLWDTHTGQTRHTLTGHGAAVTCVRCSPLEPSLAVSCSEDRSIKLWDLSRGYLRRSIPVAKMPNALTISMDGNIIITGHLDGTLSFWDRRQCESAGVKPFAECKEVTQSITCVTANVADGGVLSCSRDNVVRLWDLRAMQPVRALRSPQFVAGTFGSMGRGKNRVEAGPDGRYVAAGAQDGGVVVWDTTAGSGAASSAPSSTASLSGTGGREPVKVLRHHKDAVVACGWSTDGSVLVSADKAGTVAFWQLTSA